MIDRPIIFSAPLVRALIENRKSMTRRLAWRDCRKDENPGVRERLPSPWQKVKPGDRLWVRESFALASISPIVATINNPMPVYREGDGRTDYGGPWKPSIHMPRWASRLTLIVTATKIERLQEISEEDAKAEGVLLPWTGFDACDDTRTARSEFEALWNILHGDGSWISNPEVVALTFQAIKANIDSLPVPTERSPAGTDAPDNQGRTGENSERIGNPMTPQNDPSDGPAGASAAASAKGG